MNELRLRACNDAPVDARGEYVLYWMTASRRTQFNFALERAVERALELEKPLVVLEALRCDHPHASDRLHSFVIDGMRANARALEGTPVRYHAHVERAPGRGRGLLEALAKRAAVVVTDDWPAFFLPRMLAAAAPRLGVRLEVVDSCGLLPIRAAESAFSSAYAFRRFLQRALPEQLVHFPARDPVRALPARRRVALPRAVLERWPSALPALADLPIDHGVAPLAIEGGASAGEERLETFLETRLARYADDRNQPEEEATSGLSPYLHFGHVSPHAVLARLAEREGWSPGDLDGPADGAREGWWRMSRSAEAFLDQVVTWRELGFNACAFMPAPDHYESLPEWARATLAEHANDPRVHVYSLEEFEAAHTHDELWNAAQRQLVREGAIHNYLRMLWGKKILEWSTHPRDALAVMLELNDKYALDGRDPNSLSGIFWILGRYDRPWAPVRPIFGRIRYMSSRNTARKTSVRGYLARYGEASLSP
jgi:deoxyribodipyrimidine photo-lyase